MRIRQIIVLLIIASLLAVTACASPASSPTPTQKTPTPTSKIIEKDVEIKFHPREIDWLSFYLKVGDRVEGEVSLNKDALEPRVFEAMGRFVCGIVNDPYGNTIVQRDYMTKPWRFAFIAYTDGDYDLGVYFSGQVQDLTPSAHIKITIYEGELSPTSQFK